MSESGPLTDEQIEAVREAVRRHLEHHNIRQTELARNVSLSSATISQFLRGGYRGDVSNVARELNGWIELDARRRRYRAQKDFVWTSVALAMRAAAEEVHEQGVVGLVYGPAGIGKTLSARAVAEEMPGAVYVLVGADDAGVTGLRGAIYEAVTRNKRSRAVREQVGIVERLEGSGRLLILDQAHKLTDRAIEYVFDLHDRTGCPVLLVGTAALREKLARDRNPQFGQIYSRVALRVNLLRQATRRNDGGRLFTIEEIRRIFARGKVRLSHGAAKYLTDVANVLGHGCLRLADRLVQWGSRRARRREKLGRDEPVTVTDEDMEMAQQMLDDEFVAATAPAEPASAATAVA